MITNSYASEEDLQIIEVSAHERHTGNPIKAASRQIDHQIRTLAATSNESTRNIVQKSAEALPTQEALIVLASRKPKNSARNVQHQRQALRNEPDIPTTAIFEIPEEIRTMVNGENFILGDWTSEDEKDRILLMGNIKCNLLILFRLKWSIIRVPEMFSYCDGWYV